MFEVEDREAVPGLGDLALAPLPHGRDMLLERVEVAHRRGSQDGRAEGQVRRVQDRVVIGVSRTAGRAKALDQLDQRADPEPSGEVVVEGRDRLAEQDRVVRAARIGGQEPATHDLEVEPGLSRARRSGEAPRRARRAVSFADVRDPHPSGRSGRIVGPCCHDPDAAVGSAAPTIRTA